MEAEASVDGNILQMLALATVATTHGAEIRLDCAVDRNARLREGINHGRYGSNVFSGTPFQSRPHTAAEYHGSVFGIGIREAVSRGPNVVEL